MNKKDIEWIRNNFKCESTAKYFDAKSLKYKFNVLNVECNECSSCDEESVEKWNHLYRLLRGHVHKGTVTKSNGIAQNSHTTYVNQYVLIKSKDILYIDMQHDLMVRAAFVGLRKGVGNITISGGDAYKALVSKFKEYGIDIKNYAVSKEEGLKIKSEIVHPAIDLCNPLVDCGPLNIIWSGDVHHIDLNSAYAAGIVDSFPELRDPYEEIYRKRKEKDGYYKSVLAQSQGYFQSPYINYRYAKLAKAGINWTRKRIDELTEKLIASGRRPIVRNTDGIWYQGEIYHDADEGTELGQWKTDHKNCCFCVKSRGCYQFIEDNQVHTVYRGVKKEITDPWKFGEIFDPKHADDGNPYIFVEELGYVKEKNQKTLY